MYPRFPPIVLLGGEVLCRCHRYIVVRLLLLVVVGTERKEVPVVRMVWIVVMVMVMVMGMVLLERKDPVGYQVAILGRLLRYTHSVNVPFKFGCPPRIAFSSRNNP